MFVLLGKALGVSLLCSVCPGFLLGFSEAFSLNVMVFFNVSKWGLTIVSKWDLKNTLREFKY